MKASRLATPDYSILAPLDQPIARPKTSALYHICLLLVAGAMLVLPLIYIGFVGGLAWAVYYHAVYDWAPIMHLGGFTGGGRIVILKFMLYAVPLFAGVAVAFFMFKPLLAGRPKRAQPLALNPSDNPLLYAFIAKICDAVGAPAPQRIDMDCELNASASFRRGFRSMAKKDLVLTIGLPLAANLSTRELAGVIAHEFGHFTQGAGMRLSYIIVTVNHWFYRVAYQRDAWDEALENWSQEVEDGRVAMIVWTVQLAVWFSRLLLKLLMFIGLLIAGFMSRQMEYDADACQISLVGTGTFEATHRKLAALAVAWTVTGRQIHAQWKKSGQLPDNLSELVRQNYEDLPENVLQKIDDELGFQKTGFFDSHPSPADRIRRGRLAAEPGIFHDARPASALFASFEHPARFVTLLHYTDDLGIPVTQQMLLHVESTQSKEARGYAAGTSDPNEEYFLGVLPLLLPLDVSPPIPSVDQDADLAELHELATGLEQVAGQLAPIALQYAEATRKLLKARAASRLLSSGVPVKPEAFELSAATPAAAAEAETEAATARDDLRHSIHEVSAALSRRLRLALAIRLAEPAGAGSGTTLADTIVALVDRLNQFAQDYANKVEAMDSLAVWNHISAVRDAIGETPALSRALEAQKAIVSSFVIVPQNQPSVSLSKPALQLQLAKHPNAASELESFGQKTIQWLVDYHKDIRQLAEIASQAEELPG